MYNVDSIVEKINELEPEEILTVEVKDLICEKQNVENVCNVLNNSRPSERCNIFTYYYPSIFMAVKNNKCSFELNKVNDCLELKVKK